MKCRQFLRSAAASSAVVALLCWAPAQAAPVAAPAKAAPAKAVAAKPAGVKASPYVLKSFDVYGKPISLTEHAGKSVLISFFTVDCIKCINDLRLMREFYGDNKKRNYVNIAVSLDGDGVALKEYMELLRKTIPPDRIFPIASRGAKGHTDNFGAIKSMPTHFLLNREHQLVMRRDGIFKADDWDELWTSLDE